MSGPARGAAAASRIYVLDELVARPGMADACRRAYLERYAPGARQRGMRLELVRMTPPLALSAASSTLQFLWSVENVQAWWAMRAAAGADPAVHAWWAQVHSLTVSRRRCMLTDLPHTAEGS